MSALGMFSGLVLSPQGVESQLLISVAAPSCQRFSEGSGLEGTSSRCQAYTFPNS